MSGFSLRARLRWLIIGVLVIVLVPLGVLSFQRTLKEVDELMDGRLAESARTLEVLVQHAGIDSLQGGGERVPIPTEAAMKLARSRHTYTYEAEVGFQVFDRQGRATLATANVVTLPPPKAGDADFQDLLIDPYRWRVYTLRDAARGVVIRTAERYDSRNGILRACGWTTRATGTWLAIAGVAGRLGSRPWLAAVGGARAGAVIARAWQPQADSS